MTKVQITRHCFLQTAIMSYKLTPLYTITLMTYRVTCSIILFLLTVFQFWVCLLVVNDISKKTVQLVNMLAVISILTIISASSFAQYYDVQNYDGSYSIGMNSYGQGQDTVDAGEALLSLLTKSQGWTETSLADSSDSDPTARKLGFAFTDAMEDLLKKLQLVVRRNNKNIQVIQKFFSVFFDFLKYVTRSFVSYMYRWAFGDSYHQNGWRNRFY